MKINADLSQRALMDSDSLPWVESPLPGVERRMLERDGEEVARATSLVRYAADSHFSPHVHDGGEEFLVLEGVFSDEHGDYGPGMYVRNPPGSRHRPHSEAGCIILVKLRQMAQEDQSFVRIDSTTAAWSTGPEEGVEQLALHRYGSEEVALLRFAAGARLPDRKAPGGMEVFVLAGDLADQEDCFGKGIWLRIPPGGNGRLSSPSGGTIYLKTGHLST